MLDRKLGGILEIYEKFQGVDPRDSADEDFPRRPLFDGGPVGRLRADAPQAGLTIGSPRNQQTNIPGLYAIGECDYQYHGANRLGANSLLSCIFSGLIVAPGIETRLKSLSGAAAAEHRAKPLRQGAAAASRSPRRPHPAPGRRRESLPDPPGVGPNDDPRGHRRAAQRRARRSVCQVCELEERAERCSLSDTGHWTNQNVVFTKALADMFPLAKTILKGALATRRMPRSPFQARIRHAGHRSRPIRPSIAARPRPGATDSRRTPANG